MSSLTLCCLIIIGFIEVAYISAAPASITNDLAAWLVNKTVKCPIDEPSKNGSLDVSKINVYFHDYEDKTKNVHSISIKDAAQTILSKNKLNTTKEFFIFVSGFNTDVKFKDARDIRDIFNKVNNSYLIIIDHSAYTKAAITTVAKYNWAFKHVKSIAKQLSQMLAKLVKGGIPAKKIHAMGHSLGSQILGQVGKNFLKSTGKKIARISALDPAGPCFSNSPVEEQIGSGAAEYVEVYHCNSNLLGTKSTLADVDFFVNDGYTQPECGSGITVRDSCSHSYCLNLWKESVLNPKAFTAYKCDDYDNFIKGKCKQNSTTAGFWNPGTAKGKYYFTTKGHILL